MLITIPGFGTNVNVTIAVDVRYFGFVASFAAENQVLFELLAFAVEIFPDEPFMRRFLRQWASS